MKSSKTRLQSERGSLLIVALIISAVIGISLASYIQLGRSSLNISNRALYNNEAINMAETGLEEAMYAVNQMVADSTYAWPLWKKDGTNTNAWRQWTGYQYSQNATGSVKVHIYNYKGGSVAPKIVARSTVQLGGAASAPIEKWLEVTLGKTSKFANGLVAKNSIVFNGTNTSVDSWNSNPDNNSATAAIPYSTGVRRDQGTVASISVGPNSILVKQADVYGYVSTNSTDPTSTVGNNGSILGSTSVYDPATWTSTTVDPSRVATSFAANFDPVSAPVKGKTDVAVTYNDIPSITDDTELPLPADVGNSAKVNADGYYYYRANQINFSGKLLKITGKVILQLTNSGTAVDIGGGSGALTIGATNSALEIYTPGEIKIAGQGVTNGGTTDATAGQPINFQIWGTATSGTQKITVAGNGVFSGTIYAPQGQVKINGNGSVCGSVVANDITLDGNANFHYDESLANSSAGNPFRVTKWKELTSASDRNAYSAVFALDYTP